MFAYCVKVRYSSYELRENHVTAIDESIGHEYAVLGRTMVSLRLIGELVFSGLPQHSA